MSRFRRTKDEIARGLTPEQAKAERDSFQATLANIANPPMTAAEAEQAYHEADSVPPSKKEVEKIVRQVTRKSKGEIILRIRPAKGVDADYFEFLTGKEIVVEQDEHFYKWLDHYLDKVYTVAGREKLMLDILDKGVGELINTVNVQDDIEN